MENNTTITTVGKTSLSLKISSRVANIDHVAMMEKLQELMDRYVDPKIITKKLEEI